MLELSPAEWLVIGRTVLFLVVLEGLLSADNALVLAVMVRHLPKAQQKRALRYGIVGAFVFRFIAVLLAAKILDYWQLEVLGGVYLLQLAIRHLIHGEDEHHEPEPGSEGEAVDQAGSPKRRRRRRGFWATVVGVELTDIAFSIDSILAAVALATDLPEHIRDQSLVGLSLETWTIYVGGVLGIITMRYVAGYFLLLLERFKGLAVGAYYLVGWIGLKLIGTGFHHALYRHGKPVSGGWQDRVPEWLGRNLEMTSWLFWGGMLLILGLSMLLSPGRGPKKAEAEAVEPAERRD